MNRVFRDQTHQLVFAQRPGPKEQLARHCRCYVLYPQSVSPPPSFLPSFLPFLLPTASSLREDFDGTKVSLKAELFNSLSRVTERKMQPRSSHLLEGQRFLLPVHITIKLTTSQLKKGLQPNRTEIFFL